MKLQYSATTALDKECTKYRQGSCWPAMAPFTSMDNWSVWKICGAHGTQQCQTNILSVKTRRPVRGHTLLWNVTYIWPDRQTYVWQTDWLSWQDLVPTTEVSIIKSRQVYNLCSNTNHAVLQRHQWRSKKERGWCWSIAIWPNSYR